MRDLHRRGIGIAVGGDHFHAEALQLQRDFLAQFARTEQQHARGVRGQRRTEGDHVVRDSGMRSGKCIGCSCRHARIITAMPRYRIRLALLTMLCGALSACAADTPQPRLGGLLLDGGLGETSGLVASRTHRDTLWLVEDGGNPAKLHAISKRGRRLASYAIEGISNTDWEDLARSEEHTS